MYNNGALDADKLLTWGINTGSPWDLSLILKFLGHYRHVHSDFDISEQQVQMLLCLLQGKNWDVYPTCQTLKWLAYLLLSRQQKDLARKALSMVGDMEHQGFTLQTIALPIAMLKVHVDEADAAPVLQRARDLMDQESHFRECLEAGGWQTKFAGKHAQDWDIWDIVTLLPFYYG